MKFLMRYLTQQCHKRNNKRGFASEKEYQSLCGKTRVRLNPCGKRYIEEQSFNIWCMTTGQLKDNA